MNQPKFEVTKDVVNDILIKVQDLGFIINQRPHLYLGQQRWLVKAFSKILDPEMPVTTLVNREIDMNRTSIGSDGRLNIGWITNSKEVANEITTYRFWFWINFSPKDKSIVLHIERVPVKESWNLDQTHRIQKTAKKKGIPLEGLLQGKHSIKIDYKKRIPLNGLDSIDKFIGELKKWM